MQLLQEATIAPVTGVDDGQWYRIDPTTVFLDSGEKDVRAQDGGACDGNWFDPKFLQAPYITMDNNSITAKVTEDVV